MLIYPYPDNPLDVKFVGCDSIKGLKTSTYKDNSYAVMLQKVMLS